MPVAVTWWESCRCNAFDQSFSNSLDRTFESCHKLLEPLNNPWIAFCELLLTDTDCDWRTYWGLLRYHRGNFLTIDLVSEK